jgi:hypothetical protein
MALAKARRWKIGSTWFRIDPHVHAPGTLRNDGFGGAWDKYLKAINEEKPKVVALGVTDYCTLRSFRVVREHWSKGKLPEVQLLIANVELRMNIQAKKGSAVNAHLLLPVHREDDEETIRVFETKLGSLKFYYDNEDFRCIDADLVRLGRAHAKNAGLAEEPALREGAEQFKVEPSGLVELRNDNWVKTNVLVAIPSGEDGLKGLGDDDAFHAGREQLSALADVIFSGSPNERHFWLGNHRDFVKRGYRRKAVLHGSDAHTLERLLRPIGGRLCFIKGAPTSDGVRQILVEPERRVFVGPEAPSGPHPSDVIRFIRFSGAPWLRDNAIELNPGLVTIIGVRGSGKTALADSIALGGSALTAANSGASFLGRADDLAHGLTVELEWGDGVRTQGTFPSSADFDSVPMVQYLSQQFVENLCTPDGLTEPLLDELERIVFDHIPVEDRMDVLAFSELRHLLVAEPRARRDAAQQQIRDQTERIAEESRRKALVPKLKDDLTQLLRQQTALEALRYTYVSSGGEEIKKDLATNAAKLDRLRRALATADQRSQRLAAALQAVSNIEAEARSRFATLAQQCGDLISSDERKSTEPSLADARRMLTQKKLDTDARLVLLRDKGVEPDGVPLPLLMEEEKRITETLGLDAKVAKQRLDCEAQLQKLQLHIKKLEQDIANGDAATSRIQNAQSLRLDAYSECVAAMEEEVRCLQRLYQPLRHRLEEPTLKKLSFSVERSVDLTSWVERGEKLFDLRKRSPFPSGKGLAAAARHLGVAWGGGTATDVRAAMKTFVDEYAGEFPKIRREGVELKDIGDWLFSLEHVAVHYAVRYEHVELGRLSPGTRGVVLLTLYLALDEADLRPLVIDQPEENLDPKSVYAELVGFFRLASQRRQVIMVTHNANLVVNADADQVVIAASERTNAAGLPDIAYEAGGLEEDWVREAVCGLLEGGRDAFAARALRYGRQS